MRKFLLLFILFYSVIIHAEEDYVRDWRFAVDIVLGHFSTNDDPNTDQVENNGKSSSLELGFEVYSKRKKSLGYFLGFCAGIRNNEYNIKEISGITIEGNQEFTLNYAALKFGLIYDYHQFYLKLGEAKFKGSHSSQGDSPRKRLEGIGLSFSFSPNISFAIEYTKFNFINYKEICYILSFKI